MGFGRNRAERHRAGDEAFHNLLCRFDFRQRHGRTHRLDLEQAAQRHLAPGLVVDQLGIFLVGREIVGARGMLQLGNGIRRPGVVFTARAPSIFSAGIEHVRQHRVVAECRRMHAHSFFRYLLEADPFDLRRRAGEVARDELAVEADRLEDLRAAIGLVSGDAHLGHDLEQTLVDRLDETFMRFFRADIGGQIERRQRIERQPRIDRFGAVSGEQGKVMHFACRARFNHDAGAGAQARIDQMMVHRRRCQQCGNRHTGSAYCAVGQDQHVVARSDRLVGGLEQGLDGRFASGGAVLRRISDVQHLRFVSAFGELVYVVQLGRVFVRQHGLVRFQASRRAGVIDPKQVGLGTDERCERHDDLFADRVDRRVGHLRKQLLEIVVKHLVSAGQNRQCAVAAHGARCFFARVGHRLQNELEVFLRVSKRLLRIQQRNRCNRRDHSFRQIIEEIARLFDPLAVRLGGGDLLFQFGIVHDTSSLHVNQQHLARLQTPFLDDVLLAKIQHAHLGCHQHDIVVGNQVTRRAQSVAVEGCTDHATVGESHGGGAVPRLHQRRVIFVERAPLFIHQRITGPGFWYQQHHCLRHRVAASHQQFQRIVETGGVGLAFGNQRPQFFQVCAEDL